jgi:hypothetical protein
MIVYIQMLMYWSKLCKYSNSNTDSGSKIRVNIKISVVVFSSYYRNLF